MAGARFTAWLRSNRWPPTNRLRRLLVNISFGIALVILTAIAVESYQSIQSLRERAAAVEHSQQVQIELEELLTLASKARIAWRSFLSGGSHKNIADFDATAAAMPGEIGQLGRLLVDDPAQQARLVEFADAVEADFATMRRGIRRKSERGFARVGDLLGELEGTKLNVDKIERLAREMKHDAQSLLSERATASERTAERTVRFIVLGSVTSLGILLLAFGALRHDIAERELAEKKLDESKTFLDSVLENIPNMIFIKDAETLRFVGLNKAGEQLLGFSRADLIGKNDHDFFPAAEADRFAAKDREVLASGALVDVPEEPVHTQSGEVKILHTKKLPLADQRGVKRYLLGISEDITLRKQAEEALRCSEEWFRLMVENVLEYSIIMLDPQGRVVSWNAGAERIKGYAAEEIIGSHVSRFYPPEVAERCDPRYDLQMAAAQGRFEEVGWRVRKDGSRFWADVVITALRDDDGRLRGYSKITRDLTERKRMERLEEEGRQMHEFLAMLAHELRNPLAPIRNATGIMRLPTVNASQLAWCRELIERQVGHLTRLVDDLLDVSRITTGKIALSRETIDVAALIAHAVESTRPVIDAKRHQLDVDLPSEPLRVYGDITRLSQVIWNLLNNAAKYTPEGGHIRVGAAREGEHVLVIVRDDGIGIAPHLIERVFDLFSQGDRGLDRSEGGLGIGLTLVRRIVAMHGGKVEAASDGVGRGAEFRVWLPIVSAAAAETTRLEPELQDRLSVVRRRVLVVDDNKDSAESLAVWLRLAGHEVDTAHDGFAALTRAARTPPQIVLLDIGLPGMNGYEVAKEIRASPGLAHVRLVAMTGYGQEEDRRRALEAGFDAHLVKPLSPSDIARVLS